MKKLFESWRHYLKEQEDENEPETSPEKIGKILELLEFQHRDAQEQGLHLASFLTPKAYERAYEKAFNHIKEKMLLHNY